MKIFNRAFQPWRRATVSRFQQASYEETPAEKFRKSTRYDVLKRTVYYILLVYLLQRLPKSVCGFGYVNT